MGKAGTTGRNSGRPPRGGSDERFAAAVPKERKRAVGTSAASDTPLHIRALGIEVPEIDRERVRERSAAKLGKYALSMTRLSVRFTDESGPKGAPVVECRVKVMLRNAADVVVAARGATPRAAFDAALDSTERTVRRTVQKRAAARGR